ncbi:MAG: phosphotransferase [Oceanospirillaceae bacterium]|nr:phosphotransferase [Oceanospirillaceae bacterium]
MQQCSLIRRGFNDHYLILMGDTKYILRVYLNDKYYIESFEAFQFELNLLEHLHNDGVPVANVIRLNSGELLGCMSTDYGDRAFALFPYALGNELKRGTITIEQCFVLGKTLAELHLSANHFHSKYQRYHLDLKYLVDEPLRLIGAKINAKDSELINDQDKEQLQNIVTSLGSIESLVETVKNLSDNQDEFGIIHADLHTGNVHFLNNDLVIFDFDHCAFGWRAYDISISFFLPNAQRDSMLRGYESKRPLSKEERECLPVFFKLRRLWDIGDMLATENLRAKPVVED